MKKIMSLLLAALMIVSVTSCGKTEPNADNNDVNEPANSNEESKEIQYVFYSSGADTDGGTVAGVSGFNNASKLNFDLDKQLNTVTNQNKVSNRKEITVDGQSYDFSYSYTRSSVLNDLSRSELSLYGECDVYTATQDDGNIELRVYNHTGNVRSWSRMGLLERGDGKIPSDVTEEKLIKKARSVIQTFYGEDVLDEYTLKEVEHSNYHNAAIVSFCRDLHGYAADAHFMVVISYDMDIVKFSVARHYEFEVLENDVTEEMIQNAEQALRACVPSSMTVQENTVTVKFDVNTEKLYLELYAYRNTPVIDPETGEESYVGEKFYVNIT